MVGIPLDVFWSKEQMTPEKAAEILTTGMPTSEAKVVQYLAAKTYLAFLKTNKSLPQWDAGTGQYSFKDMGKVADIKHPNSGNNSNPITINKGQQNKHIEGTNEHKISLNSNQNKSIVTVPPETLLSNLGKGEQVGKIPVGQPGSKERINYGKIIGNYTDPVTGQSKPTTNGIVHYGKNGVHIVPSRPSE